MISSKRFTTIGSTLMLAAGMAATSGSAMAYVNSACGQTLSNDTKAIAKDLSVIAAQAKSQGFATAVEQFASDMEAILPTLNKPSQQAVQKFVSDLSAATSATGPGGTTITPSERLQLTMDWTILLTSTGLTSAELTTITDDLVAVMGTLNGISTVQLQSDINVLHADAKACAGKL